jgi:hypothetical protein
MLEWLASHSVFGSVDCKSGYWQVPLEMGSQDKTAFITPAGLYQYRRVPFGLKNAPPHFMRCIDTMMQAHEVDGSRGFVDDLLTGGKNIKEYLARVRQLLNALR